jgi:hypothetical protein
MLSTKSWRSAPIGFAVSVCMQQFKNGITELLKFVLTFQFCLKYDNNNRHFTWRPECISACRCDWVGNPQPTLDTVVVWGILSLPWILWLAGESPVHIGCCGYVGNPQPTLGIMVIWGIHHSHLNNCDVTGAIHRGEILVSILKLLCYVYISWLLVRVITYLACTICMVKNLKWLFFLFLIVSDHNCCTIRLLLTLHIVQRLIFSHA